MTPKQHIILKTIQVLAEIYEFINEKDKIEEIYIPFSPQKELFDRETEENIPKLYNCWNDFMDELNKKNTELKNKFKESAKLLNNKSFNFFKEIYKKLRPGEPPDRVNAEALIKRLFLDSKLSLIHI